METPHPSTSSDWKPDAPLIDLNSYQRRAFWAADDFGMLLLLWRRQGRKTTTQGALALRRMMEKPWRLVTYASASIAVGGELLMREAQLWRDSMDKWRRAAAAAGKDLQTNFEGVDIDGFCDLFEHGKVEVKLFHDRTSYSRTKLIAPNPATARGYSGFVMIDEIGFIRDFKDLWEAMEPIASSQPDFRVVMATTPPADDGHFSYELTVPPEGLTFAPNPDGHFYESQAGVQVHRVGVNDAEAAGVKLYDLKTRKPITPEESRARAIDRDAWDRNYALIFKTGGTSAVSLQAIHNAMLRGRGQCIAAENDFPSGWQRYLGGGRLAIGLDLATTENEKSNPSAIAIGELVGNEIFFRVVVRWKTSDDRVTSAMVREALDVGPSRRVSALVIDATSERFYAAGLRREFSSETFVELVVSSEKTEYLGEPMLWKAYLGNLVVNAMDDGRVAVPEERWLKDDFRLVVRNKGSFDNLVDGAGNHGDTFDACKLAAHGLLTKSSGPAEAHAAPVGSLGALGLGDGRGTHRLPI